MCTSENGEGKRDNRYDFTSPRIPYFRSVSWCLVDGDGNGNQRWATLWVRLWLGKDFGFLRFAVVY